MSDDTKQAAREMFRYVASKYRVELERQTQELIDMMTLDLEPIYGPDNSILNQPQLHGLAMIAKNEPKLSYSPINADDAE